MAVLCLESQANLLGHWHPNRGRAPWKIKRPLPIWRLEKQMAFLHISFSWMHAISQHPYMHLQMFRVLICTSIFSMFLLNGFVGVETTFALHPIWGIDPSVFHFVAMMSMARHRVIIRKIPMKLFIVTTVMMLARMLFTNLLNFLLIRILGKKVLSCLCTKNRFSAHEQFIFYLKDTEFYKREGCSACLYNVVCFKSYF